MSAAVVPRTTIEQEINKRTGVLFKGIPADGKLRKFKVSHKEWYALNLGDCAVFGCESQKVAFGWNGGKSFELDLYVGGGAGSAKKLSARQLEEERRIVDIGNAFQDSGQPMSDEDLDRYILALARVISGNAN